MPMILVEVTTLNNRRHVIMTTQDMISLCFYAMNDTCRGIPDISVYCRKLNVHAHMFYAYDTGCQHDFKLFVSKHYLINNIKLLVYT